MISYSIMAIPERAAAAAKLWRQLNEGAVLVYDRNRSGPRRNWVYAWRMRDPAATHHVVLQDDVLLCFDFPSVLARVVAARPDDVITCFSPNPIVRQAYDGGYRWAKLRRFRYSQCLVLPVSIGDTAAEYLEKTEDIRADDDALHRFFKRHSIPVYATAPCLVQHDTTLKSVVGSVPKRAAVFQYHVSYEFDDLNTLVE